MTFYILNSPILTDYGLWAFEGPLLIDQVRSKLTNGFVSAIGHRASANVLSQHLNICIPAQRRQINMKPGDEALILRLKQRLPEGKILNEGELKALDFELGLLTRLK